jgi:hypothetical protein
MTPTVSSSMTWLAVTTDPWSPELVVHDIFFVSQNPPIGPIHQLVSDVLSLI